MTRFAALVLPLAAFAGAAAPAQQPSAASSTTAMTYADLVDLADRATVVARAQVREVVPLRPGQGSPPRPGTARVYVEARTRALLVGEGLGESIRYIAEVPLDTRGRLPRLAKREVLIFARAVPRRPGELQLTAPDAQLPWSPVLEQRARAVLAELVAPGAAPRVLGVREAMHVRGNLIGEGETQMFMATAGDAPVSISVVHRPGAPPVWGVSLSEIVDQAARPPARETLTWYRLACFLPPDLAGDTVLPGDPRDRRQAMDDYRFVRVQLGLCPRSRAQAYRP